MAEQEEQETPQRFTFGTVGFDARFPNTNQTKHCFQSYIDYHRCINAKGEDFVPCKQFWHAFQSLCPSDWVERWDEQRDNGIFPVDLETNTKQKVESFVRETFSINNLGSEFTKGENLATLFAKNSPFISLSVLA